MKLAIMEITSMEVFSALATLTTKYRANRNTKLSHSQQKLPMQWVAFAFL